MIRPPHNFTRPDTLLPYPALFRSAAGIEVRKGAEHLDAQPREFRNVAARGIAGKTLDPERRLAHHRFPPFGCSWPGIGRFFRPVNIDRDRKSTRLNSSH